MLHVSKIVLKFVPLGFVTFGLGCRNTPINGYILKSHLLGKAGSRKEVPDSSRFLCATGGDPWWAMIGISMFFFFFNVVN